MDDHLHSCEDNTNKDKDGQNTEKKLVYIKQRYGYTNTGSSFNNSLTINNYINYMTTASNCLSMHGLYQQGYLKYPNLAMGFYGLSVPNQINNQNSTQDLEVKNSQSSFYNDNTLKQKETNLQWQYFQYKFEHVTAEKSCN